MHVSKEQEDLGLKEAKYCSEAMSGAAIICQTWNCCS